MLVASLLEVKIGSKVTKMYGHLLIRLPTEEEKMSQCPIFSQRGLQQESTKGICNERLVNI